MSDNQEGSRPTRRQFLRNAAMSAAAVATARDVAKSSVYSLAPQRVIGANDRIVVAHVGMGGQGMFHLNLMKPNAQEWNVQQAAVCDLYVRRKKKAQEALGLKDSQAFDDYRKIVDDKDVDAVWVTTSDQWHAPIAMDAMNAGKHVYIEKPMCKTLEEAFAIYDTAKKTKRVVQIGSQGTSAPIYHEVAKLVKSGKFGKLVMCQGTYCRNSIDGEWEYKIDEDAGPNAKGDGYVNWAAFARRSDLPWDPDIYFRWRKWWAIGSGLVGDLLPHRLHPHFIAAGLSTEGLAGFPMRVSSMGGLYVQKVNPKTGKPDRDVPDYLNMTADFPDGPSLVMMTSSISEQGWPDMIRLNKASIAFGGDTIEVNAERAWSDEVEGEQVQSSRAEDIPVHQKNFLDAIRTGIKPNANIDLAVRVQTIITLAELSYRNGVMMHFDPKTRKAWSGVVPDPYAIQQDAKLPGRLTPVGSPAQGAGKPKPVAPARRPHK